MPRAPRPELRVATADGPGSGRFLVRALLDALEAGSDLASVAVDPSIGHRDAWAIEFTFAGQPRDGHEVIRAGLDAGGRIVTAELLRTPRGGSGYRYRRPGELAAALRAGEQLLALRLESGPTAGQPRAIVLSLRNAPPFTLDLAAFDPDLRRPVV